MKLQQLILYLLIAATPCYAQGIFFFSNRGRDLGALAPVYGPDPVHPSLQLWGNTPEGRPPGTQAYAGSLVLGPNFSVEAWYMLAPAADPFALAAGARPVDTSLTSFRFPSEPGFFARIDAIIPGPNLTGGGEYPYYAYLQVRAWDNGGGLYTSWGEAWDAANRGSGLAVGWSAVFYQPLRSQFSLPQSALVNFESFNLFIVPEPSTVGLVLAGAVVLLSFRRKRR